MSLASSFHVTCTFCVIAGTVGFKTTGKTNNYLWPEMAVSKRLPKLYVKSDADILTHIDPDELKQVDWTGVFLPVLISLTTGFSNEELLQWIGGDSDKNRKRIRYAKKKAQEDKRALVKCEAALCFLKKKHVQVCDMRIDCALVEPRLQVIEPSMEDGWEFVRPGDELKDKIAAMCRSDKKVLYDRKRSFYISGKMGVGKTRAILYFVKERMTEDVYKNVTYFGPRTVLVKQVSDRMKEIKLASSVHKRKKVYVERYYSGMEDEDDRKYIHGMRTKPDSYNTNVFHAACINSAGKTPLHPDVVIVDEAVVDAGNMFIHSTQAFYRSRNGHQNTKECIRYDREMIEHVIARIKNASVVIYIDAAFTKEVIETFRLILNTSMPFVPMNYNKSKDRKQLQLSVWRAKKKNPDSKFYVNDSRTRCFQVMRPIHLAVYDPEKETGMFTQMKEYFDYEQLKSEIIKTIENNESCIVYTSCSRTATYLITMAKKKASDNSHVPMMTLVTAEMMKTTKNADKCINDMNSSYLVFASNVLSCGVSFEQPQMFDKAFAVFEFSAFAPPIGDMIQLCARVRSITTKTLHYIVTSKGASMSSSADESEPDMFVLRHQELQCNPVCLQLHKLNEAEYMDHLSMCREKGYASACVRKALQQAFTHVKNPTGPRFVPSYTTVSPPGSASSTVVSRHESARYREMCNDLPKETKYCLYADTKRPIYLPRNDLKRETCMKVVNKVAYMKTKGGFLHDSFEPIPFKKQKLHHMKDMHDEPPSECCDSSSLVSSCDNKGEIGESKGGNQEIDSDAEFESRADM